MTRELLLSVVLSLLPLQAAFAQYGIWRHSGTIVILTTPDGADLPSTALEEGFPVLVRLSRDRFDFSQARADGGDIRFSARGKPLPYEIDEWDVAKGAASIWVRTAVIEGNTRQEIEVYWGNAAATSESDGAKVFNESNGFAVVMHLGDHEQPLKDEVGALAPVNVGTTTCTGVIGAGRHFEVGKGIACGEQIAALPAGLSDHTTEAWLRAERPNATIVGWGNEQAQGKVVMIFSSPPHIRMDCYFSSADVASKTRLPISQWIHVVHTYHKGDSRIYVNGQLDGVSTGQGARSISAPRLGCGSAVGTTTTALQGILTSCESRGWRDRPTG